MRRPCSSPRPPSASWSPLVAGAVGGKALTACAAPLVVAVLAVHWLVPLWVAGPTAQDEPADGDGRTA
ncbi:hypothetical protein [Streptomyces coelicoflavus]|uniref:hypothetical protein n=1 Tax=Streptomyces coelicoflavus TaxID=285562 RepID=UPI001943A98C|nr:hypothetical protein [Streptomyces coelicoflavus]